jgi:hypothetical protein
MIDLLKDIIGIVTDLLFEIPMPWRAGVFVVVFAFLSYQILRRLLVLLLLPEFWITTLMRRLGLHSLPGTFHFDSLLGWLIKASRWTVWIAVIIAIMSIVAWYQRPYIESQRLANYIDEGLDWWYSFERSLISARYELGER